MNEIENKSCDKCIQVKTIDKYRKYCENSYSKTCKKCLNELDKIRKQRNKDLWKSNTILKKEKSILTNDRPILKEKNITFRQMKAYLNCAVFRFRVSSKTMMKKMT
jgi:hypothetical protein